MSEIDDNIKKICGHRGVTGVIIINEEGIPIRTNIDPALTQNYAAQFTQFTTKAKLTIREIDPQNELTFIRVRSKKNEIMIAPDHDYTMIVIQDPSLVHG